MPCFMAYNTCIGDIAPAQDIARTGAFDEDIALRRSGRRGGRGGLPSLPGLRYTDHGSFPDDLPSGCHHVSVHIHGLQRDRDRLPVGGNAVPFTDDLLPGVGHPVRGRHDGLSEHLHGVPGCRYRVPARVHIMPAVSDILPGYRHGVQPVGHSVPACAHLLPNAADAVSGLSDCVPDA